MSRSKRYVVVAVAVVLIAGVARNAAAQVTLTAARELYAAAAYDEALTALNDLSTKGEANSDPGAVALYRALCLYGLGKTLDGDRAVETLVAQHPLYRPALDDLAPRIRATVLETRRRMLPAVLQQQYAEAKSAFDRQDFAAAAAGFTRVLDGLEDPDIAAAASQSPLADLRTLSGGFRDLAQKAIAPPPVAAAPAPAPVAAPIVPPPPRIYTADDNGIIAPVVVRQAIPPYPRAVPQRKTAVVQLVINEAGAVETAAMVTPLDPQYDRTVLAATKTWQYQPAKMAGAAVKYRKYVQITLVPPAK
jgi:TonB family protein